ncbi:MAG: AAA family ATPase, partial [Gemmatimonadota bacterium]|nr:AAA family ATPase [Gemmatimonadota bacterium]
MSAPMIRAVELEFGRHARSFELPDSGPVVIVGPNGCGKTTVVDALFRTVYGFRRRRAGDAELLQARRPWSGGPYRATIRVLDPEGRRLTWSRDFDTDVVCVRDAEGALLYDGEANPGGTGPSVERYRELVRSVFGLDDLDDFERTTCIRQGALMDTAFDDGLLALAEGGHARVRSAIDKIETAHKELSRQPVVEGGRRLNRNRLLDLASHALADTRSRLEEARRADRARGPIVLRLADLEEQEASLGAELGELESALRRLHERATAAAVREAAAERLDRLVQLRADLDAADRDAETAGRELVLRAETGEYPDDFRTRAADLRSAWTRRAALDEQLAAGGIGPAGWSMGGAGAASLVTGAWFAVRGSVVGWLGMLFGAVAGTWVLVREFAARRVRRDALAERGAVVQNIASLLEEVPDPGTVTPATLPD